MAEDASAQNSRSEQNVIEKQPRDSSSFFLYHVLLLLLDDEATICGNMLCGIFASSIHAPRRFMTIC
jgi:hypothetical protein